MRTSGKSIPEVSRDHPLTESALKGWVQRAEVENSSPSELTAAEREELAGLMRMAGLAGRYPKRLRRTTISDPLTTIPDLVRRDITPTSPNQQWVADITYIRTAEG